MTTTSSSFATLGLNETLLRAVTAEGYAVPTPIQAQAIPVLLEGRDVLGIAQTGTGKTAAFALPMLQRLMRDKRKAAPRRPRALVLTPTRELAVQIRDGFSAYGRASGLSYTVVYGGVGQNPQVKALAHGCDIVVATPGRLLDLMNQRAVDLGAVEIFVLDEADRMLDMGFIHDVRRITSRLPAQRQTLLFSATMPDAVLGLAKGILTNHQRIEVTPPSTTVERIAQRVMFVAQEHKSRLLEEILRTNGVTRALVFTRTKHGANRLALTLAKAGIGADAIHGNKSQNARQRSLDAFKSGRLRVLVATDIAARGIDVDNVSHVVNFELPAEPESYVHRIGRTARAGAEGIALSFCGPDEVGQLKSIERTIRQPIPVDIAHRFHNAAAAARQNAGSRDKGHNNRDNNRRRGRNRGRGGDAARHAA